MTKIKVIKYPINKKDKKAVLIKNAEIDHLKNVFKHSFFVFYLDEIYLSHALSHSLTQPRT